MSLPQDVKTYPLCVDLDGTLISTDTLFESVIKLITARPYLLLLLPTWLLRGKANLKAEIARRAQPDVTLLPYRVKLLSWIREQAQCRPVVLVSAAHQSVVDAVADHTGCFRKAVGSNDTNLSGDRKADWLVQEYGHQGFDYAGNSSDDLPVWRKARSAIVVAASSSTLKKARSFGNVAGTLDCERGSLLSQLKLWVRAIRSYQWIKNLLVFLAPLAAHSLNYLTLVQALLAFIAFSLAASAIYIVNDLVDIEADRAHPRKRARPFASGQISLLYGVFAAILLGISALVFASLIGHWFAAVLMGYMLLTTAYSFGLKQLVVVDVVALAVLYTSRVLGGAVATDVDVSAWLFALCLYGFLSLAMVKRYAELVSMSAEGKHRAKGRGYTLQDTPVVLALGGGVSMVASLVVALHINSDVSRSIYQNHVWLWLIPLMVILGMGRLWIETGRGNMNDDPIVYVAKDSVMWVIGTAIAISIWLAL
jgi:4-hydroxybenzoate polyprenyltransferase